MADLRERKKVKIVVICALVFGLGIVLVAYLQSNARVKNIFANNIQTFDCYADYLIGISENYPDDTEFIIYGDSYGYKDNYKIERLELTRDEIPWEVSDRPNFKQQKAINRIFKLSGDGVLSMTKTSDGCIISIVFNGNSDNWKEIVYSTDPNRIVSSNLANAALESYKYTYEELAPNWMFWHTK